MVAIALLGMLIFNRADTTGDVGELSLEKKLANILEQIDGVNEVHVMIAEDEAGAPCGAVIVTNGIKSVQTWLDVQSAARAALGIDVSRIRVIGLSGMEGG